jgi:outer membrane protein assembly factor BamE (lipoprotein component of BamABCDE complex)
MPENIMTTSPIKRPLIRVISLSALAGLVLGASGCTRLRAHQGYVGDQVLLTSVQPGVDNKQSVETSLGRPTFVGQFDNNDWYYYARDTKQLAFAQPKAASQFMLHVRFDPTGNVSTVQQTGMENIARINPEGDKTPTLGRHTSFFEELFGNIGTVGAGGASGQSGQGGGPNGS